MNATENREILLNPYKYYNNKHVRKTTTIDNVEQDLDTEDEYIYEYDEKVIQDYFNDVHSKSLTTTHPSIQQALKYDPAYLLDPVEDHYKKLIPQQMLDELSEDDIEELISIYDPVTWAKKYLLQKHGGWKPRASKKGIPYQSMMIRCKSPRIVSRAGRRLGKSASLVVRILHKAFTFMGTTKPTFNIVIFTPYQSQLDVIFKMMEVFIDGNPRLMSMITANNGAIPTRKNPNYSLEINNGVCIKGFVSGSAAVRGSAADFLVLDEASYLSREDTDSVVALINEHPDVEVWVSSTPKGEKDWFFDRCIDKNYVTMHFPSNKFHPNWNASMEDSFRTQLSEHGYKTEVLAVFDEDGTGVFQKDYVNRAYKNINMNYQQREENWIYGCGVDWNSSKNGTQIKIVGFDITERRFRVVDTKSIAIAGWTQTKAVEEIQNMNRKWLCNFIYVDAGYGAMQIEAIHKIGADAIANSPDKNLIDAKAIDFGSAIEVYDMHIQKKVKKPMKPFLVNNSVLVFENNLIDIPESESKLKTQLCTYMIDGYSPAGAPRFKAGEEGDHELDALMLALLGFTLEYSEYIKPNIQSDIKVVPNFLKQRDGAIDSSEYRKYIANKQRDELNGFIERGEVSPMRAGVFGRPLRSSRTSTIKGVGHR